MEKYILIKEKIRITVLFEVSFMEYIEKFV